MSFHGLIIHFFILLNNLPCGASQVAQLGKELLCKSPRRCRFILWIRKIHWRKKWQPTPLFLPGNSHGWRSLVGCSPRGQKESDMTGYSTALHSHLPVHEFITSLFTHWLIKGYIGCLLVFAIIHKLHNYT